MANVTNEDVTSRIGSVDWTNEYNNLEKVVKRVVVEYIYTSDGTTVNHVKTYRLGAPSATSFKPYDQVTQDDVKSWYAAQEADAIGTICEALGSMWEETRNPTQGSGLPWTPDYVN